MFATARRRRPCAFVALLCWSLVAWAEVASASGSLLDDRVRRAAAVFRELRQAPDRHIPSDLLARSRCVAVIPNVLRAGFLVGGRYGKGVLSCRSKGGEWSPPVHVLMTGGSFGLQAGVSSTDVVLFFMTTNSVRSLLASKVKLSGEAGVAAGPVGRDAEVATDARFTAEIYSYARSRGLFAGVAIAGGYLGVSQEDTRAYYGKSFSPAGILFEHRVTSVPKSAWAFLGSLPKPRALPGEAGPSTKKAPLPPAAVPPARAGATTTPH